MGLENLTDETLALMAKEGNGSSRAAFSEIFFRSEKLAMRIAIKYVKNRPDAEDVVSESFMKAWRSIHTYNPMPGIHFTSWLYRIVMNEARNFGRECAKRSAEVYSGSVEEEPFSKKSDKADYNLNNEEIAVRIRDAINNLPDAYRTPTELALMGVSYEEIVEICNVPLGTVKSQTFRGRKLLKIQLAEYRRGD